MNNQIIEKILTEVVNLKTYVEEKVVTEVVNLKTYVEEKVVTEVENLKTYVEEKVVTEVENLKTYVEEKIATELIDVRVFMQENMVTRDELRESEDRVTTHMDSFIKLHENLDVELVALRGKYERLEERIVVLERQMAMR